MHFQAHRPLQNSGYSHQVLKFGSIELANVSFSDCYIRVILSKDHRNKDRKKSSETKTRDEKIRDVLIHKDRFVSDCFMLASGRGT